MELGASDEGESVTFVSLGLCYPTQYDLLQFIHLPEIFMTAFSFTAESYSTVYVSHIFIFCSSTEGHQLCFQFPNYCEQSAMNMPEQVSVE